MSRKDLSVFGLSNKGSPPDTLSLEKGLLIFSPILLPDNSS